MNEPVLVERRGRIAIVTLNLPEKRNALGAALYPALSRTLAELQNETSLRALVLHGGKHFCAGGDLAALDSEPLSMRDAMHIGHLAVRTLIGGRLPAVAAVSGSAFGAGFSLAMACDFVIGDPSTTFCAAFGKVGLAPDYGLIWTLPQRVGIGRTRELLMLCRQIPADEALSLQLLDRLVGPGETLGAAIRLAEELAAAAPATIATTKSMLSRLPLSLDTLLAWEADTQALLARTHDVREGIHAFAERRSPNFKGA
jgi:2-(1,2-epoxy-1,2-dihydrophenyl)acetyl-CoA isomerase